MPKAIESFGRLLVANRGEIALRIMRSARNAGLTTIAVYTDADAGMPFAQFADEAIGIGDDPPGESYMSIDNVIEAAKASSAQAVHPGYGFLAENADFARACRGAGLTFVGPPAEIMARMGNKDNARKEAQKVGIPILPGSHCGGRDIKALKDAAQDIGFPLMIKAVAGGGGRGMRRVDGSGALADMLEQARSEALATFGNGDLLLEKLVDPARHVEVQIVADRRGNCVHLGERDCSLQRRHQKLVEETPAPGISLELRKAVGDAAVTLARAIGYEGAGTVEFLLDSEGGFHFLEMNTRLQVEHGITELVTGLDLVEIQLRIADGQELAIAQEDISLDGHAIEARLCAENPANRFLPDTGRIEAWKYPCDQQDVRVDAGIETGSVISAHYDSLLAKIMVRAASRQEARRRLTEILGGTVLFGPATNRDFLVALLRSDVFDRGEATTGYVESVMSGYSPEARTADLVAGCALHWRSMQHEARDNAVLVSDELLGWGSAGPLCSRFDLVCDGRRLDFVVTAQDGVLDIKCGSRSARVEFERTGLRIGGRRYHVTAHCRIDGVLHVATPDRIFRIAVRGAMAAAAQNGDGMVAAPMHGILVELNVGPGVSVRRGDRLAVLEAMKMRHSLEAPIDGVVARVHASPGTQIAAGALLLEIDTGGEAGEI